MNCIVPTEPVTLEVGGETLHFQLQQQEVRQTARFIREFDDAVTAELNSDVDFFALEGAVESAPLVEEIICSILLPATEGGERLTPDQARELRLDQRMSILLGQIQLNRLDQFMDQVMNRLFQLQADRIARALAAIGALGSVPNPLDVPVPPAEDEIPSQALSEAAQRYKSWVPGQVPPDEDAPQKEAE